MRDKYGWRSLNKRGDFVFVPGVEPKHVSSLVKTHILRRLGPKAIVSTDAAPDGTMVTMVYVPPVEEEVVDERSELTERAAVPGLTAYRPRYTQAEIDAQTDDEVDEDADVE